MNKIFKIKTDSFAFHHCITAPSDYDSSIHSHTTYYEIFYLVGGHLTFHMKDTYYNLPPDSLVLIPINTPHRFIPRGSDMIERYSLHFSPRILSFEHQAALLRPFQENKYENSFYFSEISNSRLPASFDSLNDLAILPENIKSLYAQVILESILIHILASNSTAEVFPPTHSAITQRIIDYLNTHLNDDVSLAGIATALYMSKDYLNSEFKKSTGNTIKEWVQYQRIMKAQTLIHDNQATDSNSLTEIALTMGFQSYSTFYRTYKKVLGYSPSDELKTKS